MAMTSIALGVGFSCLEYTLVQECDASSSDSQESCRECGQLYANVWKHPPVAAWALFQFTGPVHSCRGKHGRTLTARWHGLADYLTLASLRVYIHLGTVRTNSLRNGAGIDRQQLRCFSRCDHLCRDPWDVAILLDASLPVLYYIGDLLVKSEVVLSGVILFMVMAAAQEVLRLIHFSILVHCE